MTQTAQTTTVPAIPTALRAGLIAGVVAAIVANAWYYASVAVTGRAYEELNLLSITVTAILPALIGALLYQRLARRVTNATLIFRAVGVTFAVLSTLPQFIQPLHEGFALATAPLHIIVGVIVVWLIPLLAPSGRHAK
ncbi:DUF6069 family protein [Deinococcus yavapaiensis]|uniref:Uncharacterized protein n=1 Tax=Deinococcus yavapaiensis KR-236 TaxID=694435 RepID=A0A318S345_9DEIO|nr:DUF6069 family protein [Deinococcus yavapaiensis]PYE50517.1 hypothetical protein DES52_11735 [Deinococcus yavapaiensis KR-236]